MGVADNKTYRDQYHFNYFTGDPHTKKLEDYPSLYTEKEVKTSIKENPYRANVEIEKGELILAPDLTSLHHAIGKKHKDGGIDVHLREGTFVFSDDPLLAFDEDDAEMGELLRNRKDKENTPAKIVKKNVDIEHYNRLFTILNDKRADNLSKKTAEKMIKKYVGILGNAALIQEGKKNFPDGIPAFAENAPTLENPYIEETEDMQKQFAKYGGKILPKLQDGKYYRFNNKEQEKYIFTKKELMDIYDFTEDDFNSRLNSNILSLAAPKWYKFFNNANTEQGWKTPTGKDSRYSSSTPNQYNNFYKWRELAGRDFTDAADYQSFIYDYIEKNDPNALQTMWKDWGNTALGRTKNYEPPSKKSFADSNLGARTAFLENWVNNIKPNLKELQGEPRTPTTTPIPKPGEVTDIAGRKMDSWKFNEWQKLQMAARAYDAAAIRRLNPYREQVDPITMDPSLLNPEQYVSDARAMSNQQLSALSQLSPILRNAQAQSVAGQLMQQIPAIRGQIDNQNSQIINSARANNINTLNQAQVYNRQADQRYYQQLMTSIANQDNARQVGRNLLISDMMGHVKDNQQLQWTLAQLQNGPYSYDWGSGQLKRNPFSIKDVEGSGQGKDLMAQVMDMYNRGIPDRVIDAYLRSWAYMNRPNSAGARAMQTISPSMRQMKKGGYNPYK